MKKVLCTIALMLLVATSAYAQATFSLTGSYWAEGKYWFNYNPGPDQKADYNDTSFGFYEQDIKLFPKVSVGNTSLNMKISITDTNWGEVIAGQTTHDLGTNYVEPDDNIAVERAFITHKFGDKFILDVGLMDGTQWGTVFGDDKTGRWRVKGTALTPVGAIGALVEKIAENGAVGENAAWENDDSDNYALFAVTKVGSVYIKPLFFYVDTDHVIPGDGDNYFKRLYYSLAFDGELGPVSFESEFNYNDYKLEAGDGAIDEDWNTWGMYFNVWKALDSMTPGFVFAYGSYDGDQAANFAALGFDNFVYFSGLDFEDDFNSTVILGDEFGWGGGDDLLAATLLKLYVNEIKTGIEPLTLSTYFAYVMSNQEDGQESISGLNTTVPNTYEDATAWEACFGASYRITDNLIYSVYGAYADINYDADNIDDPDAVYLIANAIEFNF
ncbi:conserved exported hypothetical protein [anaerobic digester metagenome]|uniref:Alginate export domain-containing protein n=1 Tax=anaerobic digester metagenome TaxID=1263854 RepID=A0A485M2H5_9ZZZZ